LLHADAEVAQGAGRIINKGLAAARTLVTLIALAVFAVLVAGFVLAAYDDHRGSLSRFFPAPLQSSYLERLA
jgi:hypothetical protein